MYGITSPARSTVTVSPMASLGTSASETMTVTFICSAPSMTATA